MFIPAILTTNPVMLTTPVLQGLLSDFYFRFKELRYKINSFISF